MGFRSLVSWALVLLLVWRGISLTARSVIAVEAVSLLLITSLIVVIFVRLGTGNAPGHQTLTCDVFKLPRGTGLAAVGFACTYGILSYGGFESSISAGDPAVYRGRGVARYRLLRVLRQRAGPWIRGRPGGCRGSRVRRRPSVISRSPMSGSRWPPCSTSPPCSALGAALVGVAVASRTLYALARDRILASALATVSHQTGTRPAR